MGQVIKLPDEGEANLAIRVLLESGEEVEVEPVTWDRHRFYYDEEAREELTVDLIRWMVEEAIEEEGVLEMVYLKSSDEKSRREVEPYRVGELSYRGTSFEGMEAYCRKRQADRVFRLDRILELERVES